MKNLKKKFRFRINLKSKHLLAIMTLFCLSCIVATFASGISTAPLQETAGIVIVPFEKSIEKIGSMVRSIRDSFKDKQDLLFENEELKAELDSCLLYPSDQHAAHEKVNYERFVKRFKEQSIESQYLNPPLVVTLNMDEQAKLKANEEYFRKYGFEIEPFGGREYCISAVPTNLYGFH